MLFNAAVAFRRFSALLLLTAMTWTAASSPAQAQSRPAPTVLQVSGAVRAPATLDLASLQALPQATAVVGAKTYTGASLWSVLNAVGLALDGSRRNPGISMYVVAVGDDGYRALFSLAELDPALGGKTVLVAYSVDGAPLGDAGLSRLVVMGDGKPSRGVFRLAELRVYSSP